MMNDVVIKLENVSKYYKLYNHSKDRLKEALHPFGKEYHNNFYALQDINLEIRKGEILGIIGRNGSGKSTLLKIISKVLEPNSGSVEVKGKISALLELGAGFNPEFTGLDNIMFLGTVLGYEKEVMEERIDSIIKFADIGSFINQPLKSYSSGMKARLGFSIAVNVDPDILILDEVLAVGDEYFKRKCYSKMGEFFEQNKTILLVSHSRKNIISLCNRAILLDKNRLVVSSDPKTVTKEYKKLINKSADENTEKKLEKNGKKYDKNIVPITLDDFKIIDNNREIKELISGQDYTLTAYFTFHEDYEDISISLQLKTIEGYYISGLNLNGTNNRIKKVSKSDVYKICYLFRCILTEGAYFFDININDSQKHIYRYTDIKKINVINNSHKFGGIVNLIYDVKVIKAVL